MSSKNASKNQSIASKPRPKTLGREFEAPQNRSRVFTDESAVPATPPSGSADDWESRVQERAYEIWKREGCPVGRDADHWRQAETELSDELKNSASLESGKSA
jgi:hypothetical protein